jgi:hypothetical protein
LGLFLGGVRQHDAAGRHFFGFQGLNHNAIVQGTQLDLGH